MLKKIALAVGLMLLTVGAGAVVGNPRDLVGIHPREVLNTIDTIVPEGGATEETPENPVKLDRKLRRRSRRNKPGKNRRGKRKAAESTPAETGKGEGRTGEGEV
jgi:hypothetical protein